MIAARDAKIEECRELARDVSPTNLPDEELAPLLQTTVDILLGMDDRFGPVMMLNRGEMIGALMNLLHAAGPECRFAQSMLLAEDMRSDGDAPGNGLSLIFGAMNAAYRYGVDAGRLAAMVDGALSDQT